MSTGPTIPLSRSLAFVEQGAAIHVPPMGLVFDANAYCHMPFMVLAEEDVEERYSGVVKYQ